MIGTDDRGTYRSSIWGELPGVFKILLIDFRVAISTSWLVYHLNERKGSPLTKLQREMTATVVNGLVGGAP